MVSSTALFWSQWVDKQGLGVELTVDWLLGADCIRLCFYRTLVATIINILMSGHRQRQGPSE